MLKIEEINKEKQTLKEEIIKINESYQIKIRQNQNIQQDILKYENEISLLKELLRKNNSNYSFTDCNENFEGIQTLTNRNKMGNTLKKIYLQVTELKNSYLVFRENTMSNLNIQKLTLEDVFVNEIFKKKIEEKANEIVMKIQKKYTNLSNERKILLHEIARLKGMITNENQNIK